MTSSSQGFLADTWQSLKRNGSAMAALTIIVITLFTAIFAYWIAPDHSPNANRMMVELAGMKPGQRQTFIALEREDRSTPIGWLESTINGEGDDGQFIPVVSEEQAGDSLVWF